MITPPLFNPGTTVFWPRKGVYGGSDSVIVATVAYVQCYTDGRLVNAYALTTGNSHIPETELAHSWTTAVEMLAKLQ